MALRATPQREVILRVLRQANDHPTADEVFRMVRERLPRISLATVYRNLEVLSRLGLIRKIELGHTMRRFDGKTNRHQHIQCATCGRVDDLELKNQHIDLKDIRIETDYKYVDCRLEFVGCCPACMKGEASRSLKFLAASEVKEGSHDER